MGKRKAQSASEQEEEEAQFSDTSSEPKFNSKPSAKKAATKKSKPEPSSPSTTMQKSDVGQSKEEDTVHTSSEGEKYIDLGKKKRATVRSFKSIPLLDIREFYGADEKPGKKGISLTLDQWQTLKSNTDVIDRLFLELLSQGKK